MALNFSQWDGFFEVWTQAHSANHSRGRCQIRHPCSQSEARTASDLTPLAQWEMRKAACGCYISHLKQRGKIETSHWLSLYLFPSKKMFSIFNAKVILTSSMHHFMSGIFFLSLLPFLSWCIFMICYELIDERLNDIFLNQRFCLLFPYKYSSKFVLSCYKYLSSLNY